jgi:hypothetical protein
LCRLGVASVPLEYLRTDLRGWIELAELEYAEF